MQRKKISSLSFISLLFWFKISLAEEDKDSHYKILIIAPDHNQVAQPIHGFGGSIAFWGTNPSDEAMHYAFDELGTSILRVQGEVKKTGNGQHSSEVLKRAM